MINFMRRNKTLSIKQRLSNSKHCANQPANYKLVTMT